MTLQDFLASARRAATEAGKAEAFDRLRASYDERHGPRAAILLALVDLELIDQERPTSQI